MLAGQTQRGLAGDEGCDAGLPGEHVSDGGRGVDQLLEVVEHYERLALGLRQFAFEALARVDRGKRDKAGAVAELGRQSVGQREGEARLADAAGPEHGDEPRARVAEQAGDRLEVGLAAHQGRGRRRQVGRGPRRCGRDRGRGHGTGEVQRGVLGEHRGLEPLELGAGIEAELLDEHGTGATERLERVGLTARAVEGEHQVGVQLLAVGVLADQLLQLGDDRGVLAEGEIQLEPVLERGQPDALQAGALGREPPEQLHVGQRRPAEEAERLAEGGGGLGEVAGGALAPGVLDVTFEAIEVEGAGRQLHRVAGRLGHDRLVLAEHAPELRDVHLQRLGGRRGRLVAPQLVDQPVGGDHAVAMAEQERGQQRALLGARHGDLAAGRGHAQRSQDREVHSGLTDGLPPRCRVPRTCSP